MRKLYTLTDEGLARILATDAFLSLMPDQADFAKDALFDAFMGANQFSMRVAKLRVEALICKVGPADEEGFRRAMFNAISPL